MSSITKIPVTRHRLFPVITGLWLAALLGLGSFAVPASLFERAVAATGLPAILPAAAPPLGFTARAGLALVLTGLGALAGFVIGRRLGRRSDEPVQRRRSVVPAAKAEKAPKIRARDSHPDAAPRKPFTASEDIAEENYPPRRRALSLTDESRPADPREWAPLPGSDMVQPLDLTEVLATDEGIAGEFSEQPGPSFEPAPDSLEVSPETPTVGEEDLGVSNSFAAPQLFIPVPPLEAAELGEILAEPDDEPAAFAAEGDEPVLADHVWTEPVLGEPVLAEPVLAEPEIQPLLAAKPAINSPVAAQALESLGLVQLVERLALAIANYNARRPGSELPQLLGPALAEMATSAQAAALHAVVHELPLQAEEPTARQPESYEAEAAEPPLSFHRQIFGVTQPATDDDEDADDLTDLPRFLGMAPPTAEPEVAHEDEEEEEDEESEAYIAGWDEGDENLPADAEDEILSGEEDRTVRASAYPSLLDMPPISHAAPYAEPPAVRTGPLSGRQMFIRVDEPVEPMDSAEPVVIFPGQAARTQQDHQTGEDGTEFIPRLGPRAESPIPTDPAGDREEADRSLRAALATLQRMTGGR